MLWRSERSDSGGKALSHHCLRRPEHLHPRSPKALKCSTKVNVERLKQYYARTDHLSVPLSIPDKKASMRWNKIFLAAITIWCDGRGRPAQLGQRSMRHFPGQNL